MTSFSSKTGDVVFAPIKPVKQATKTLCLRLNPAIYFNLKHEAKALDVSLNEFCNQALEFALENLLRKNHDQ